MTYPTADKVVLITGATGGIGAAIAKALHARGASVVLTGRRRDVLDALVLELGDRTLAMTADVTNRQALDAVVTSAAERFGGLDVVIANAGTAVDPPRTVAAVDEQQFERVIEVDLPGAVNAAYAMSKAGVRAARPSPASRARAARCPAGVLYLGWTDTPIIKPAFGGNRIATELLRHAYPRQLRTPIPPSVSPRQRFAGSSGDPLASPCPADGSPAPC